MHVIGANETALREAYGVSEPTAFLIRPDGHIAWRGAADLQGLTAYMDRFYTRLHATPTEHATEPKKRYSVAA